MKVEKLLNVILLPKKFYRRTSNHLLPLYLGIILIGMIDIGFTVLNNDQALFVGKTKSVLYYNATLSLLLILLFGIGEVLFFSIPIFDLLKRFKKQEESVADRHLLIKIMKFYILGSLMILPFNALINYSDKIFKIAGTQLYSNIVLYGLFVLLVWLCAIVSRGINEVYSFLPDYKRLVFPAIFIWNGLIHFAGWYLMSNTVTLLYK